MRKWGPTMKNYLYYTLTYTSKIFHQVALKYQDIWCRDESRVEGRYGWLMVGSHTLGSSAWGNPFTSLGYVNYHLSVAIAPYLNSGK